MCFSSSSAGPDRPRTSLLAKPTGLSANQTEVDDLREASLTISGLGGYQMKQKCTSHWDKQSRRGTGIYPSCRFITKHFLFSGLQTRHAHKKFLKFESSVSRRKGCG